MKNLLFTGASGFLGSNILPILQTMDYRITTMGRASSNDIQVDLKSNTTIDFTDSFDVILHAAGKTHSEPCNEAERQAFFDVNVMGTKNLCKSLQQSKRLPSSFIFISTVSVYGSSSGEFIDEDTPLLGNSPYALSKIQTENYLIEWSRENNIILTILRPSLIMGKNPLGNLKSMIGGIEANRYLSIAGGKARKSMIMTDDIATIIPLVEQIGGIYNLADDRNPSFHELEDLICSQLGKKSCISIPYWSAKILAIVGDRFGPRFPINSTKLEKITSTLTFSNQRAKERLGWRPTDVLENYIIR